MGYRVIALVGSMRRDGNTAAALQGVLAGAAETAGVETELIQLRDQRIEFCRGCYEIHARPGNPCVIEDDMSALRDRMLSADALVFGSPAYFGGMSGLLRTFLDRTGPLWGRLDGKLAGIVAVGADRFGGQELVAQSLTVFCRAHRLNVVGWPLCLQTPTGDRPGSLSDDEESMGAAAELGRSIVAQLAQGIAPRSKVE
jgi:multimeric flavodoxin WrbA